jgi:hypothetical protein
MKTTKKMPVSLSYEEFRTNKNEFLVPFIQGDKKDAFMGIKSGDEFRYGAISYIGKEISTNDILDKMEKAGVLTKSKEDLIASINRYLEEIQSLKIGNIIKIEYLPDGNFNLVKVAEKPPGKKRSKLP